MVHWLWVLAALVLLPIVSVVDRKRAARARREPLYAARRADASYTSVGARAGLMATVLGVVAVLSGAQRDWHVATVAFLGSALSILVLVHLRRRAHEARRGAGVRDDSDYQGLDLP